jgi:hypothetical protein
MPLAFKVPSKIATSTRARWYPTDDRDEDPIATNRVEVTARLAAVLSLGVATAAETVDALYEAAPAEMNELRGAASRRRILDDILRGRLGWARGFDHEEAPDVLNRETAT